MNVLLTHLRRRKTLYPGLFVFAWALGVGWLEIEPERIVSIEVDGDFLMGAACRLKGYCPIFGIDMRPGFQIGNHYSLLMAGVQFISENPAVFFGLGLFLHALSAVFIFLLGTKLFGVIPGLIGGWLQSDTIPILELYRTSIPASFSIIFITGTYLLSWHWVEGTKKIKLWSVAIFAGIALQIHPLAFVPLTGTIPLLLMGLRERGNKKEVWSAVVVFALVCSPLLTSISTTIWEKFAASGAASGSGSSGLIAGFLGENWQAKAWENVQTWLPKFIADPGPNWPPDIPWFFVVVGSLGVFLARFINNTMSASKWALGWGVFGSVLLSLLLFAMLGGKWPARYAFIFYPSIIVLTLFGVHLVLYRLERFKYWYPAIAGIVTLLIVYSYSQRRNSEYWQLFYSNNEDPLGYHEQLDILKSVASLGYKNIDFQSRVHGEVWHPYQMMFAYHALHLETTPHPPDGTHAVVIEDCKEVPREFARWQHRVAGVRRISVLATYEPTLKDLKIKVYPKPPCESAECEPGSDACAQSLCVPESPPCWAGDHLFTTMSRNQHWAGVRWLLQNTNEETTTQLPKVLKEEQRLQWRDCWREPAAEARIEATIQLPVHKRTLAVSHDPFLSPILFLDNKQIPPITGPKPKEKADGKRREISRFRIPSGSPEAPPMDLVLLLQELVPDEKTQNGDGREQKSHWGFQYPLFLDLFEEPVPRCAKSSRL